MADNAVIRNYSTEEAIARAILDREVELGQVISCTNTLCLYRVIQTPEDQSVWTFEKITGGGEGVPLGAIIPFYGEIIPAGYLLCDGSTFNTDIYPALAMFLEGNVLPDLREAVPVGVGETTRNIPHHDVYTIGQFKDSTDNHTHGYGTGQVSSVWNSLFTATVVTSVGNVNNQVAAHGKQLGVNYIIKAVSSVDSEDDALFQQIRGYMKNQNKLSDYEAVNETEFVAPFDGYLIVNANVTKPSPDVSSTAETTCETVIDDTATPITATTTASTNVTSALADNYGSVAVSVNSVEVGKNGGFFGDFSVSVAIKKGETINITATNSTIAAKARYYKERDY